MSRLKHRAAPPIPDSPSSSESSNSPTSSSSDAVISQFRDLVDQRVGHGHNLDTAAAHIRAAALVARLKALNRANNSATRARQQATAEARQEMDQAHLGLQNFLYEKRHLEREIEKCRQFACVVVPAPPWCERRS
jgi:THO complex subunit 5